MPFHKITYSEQFRRICVYNRGCNFRCLTCVYQVKTPSAPEKFLSRAEVQKILLEYRDRTSRVHFLGGEPTVDRELPELLSFCKDTLGVETVLGHTNGSLLPLDNLDAANIGLKAFSEETHMRVTGVSRKRVFDNLVRAFQEGIRIKANMILIPGLVDLDEIESAAKFLAGLDRNIPFHVQGYFPVPGRPWRAPAREELEEAVAAARNHLNRVTCSFIDKERLFSPAKSDNRFQSKIVWP
ncbi:MAG: radical SAM protein [Candidatus Omnitrophota bacterium]